MTRINLFRDAHPELADRFIDLKYQQIVSDPVGTISRVYRQLGLELSTTAAARMENLASHRGRYESRRPNSTLADFGIDPAEIAERFGGYCERFKIRRHLMSARGAVHGR